MNRPPLPILQHGAIITSSAPDSAAPPTPVVISAPAELRPAVSAPAAPELSPSTTTATAKLTAVVSTLAIDNLRLRGWCEVLRAHITAPGDADYAADAQAVLEDMEQARR